MQRLQDRVAIVTGAAQGIGLATAERLLADGAKVVMGDLDEARLAAAARAVDPGGARTRVCAGDVARKATATALVDLAVAAFGRLDILVNNAGMTHAADFLDLDEDAFDRVLAVNLKSMFLCGQAAARRMVAQAHGGAIVNLSSANAVVAIANQVPYVVSKGGVNQLTRVMALALAPHRIRVNGVGPGTIMTDLMKNAVLKDPGAKARILSRTPMSRFGETAEVAAVIAFLASDDASYLTGQTIYPDGGRLALNYTVPVPPDA